MTTQDKLSHHHISSLEEILDSLAEMHKIDLEIDQTLREFSQIVQEASKNLRNLL